ncbi:MAG: nucleoside triphosphate pyrophosphohydrolase family protein [Candidatus Izimaplasma sp.]|nr:nucleoside triphosphate pyrophosphohydrolase family protein [Candidatus Izimaplasma bacterium]
MELNEYQTKASSTAIYPNKGNNLIYPVLGLCGESGEVAEKVKKMIRDDNGILSSERREALKKELGDILWYVSATACELNFTLDEIAQSNIDKLFKRKEENKLKGNGDNR